MTSKNGATEILRRSALWKVSKTNASKLSSALFAVGSEETAEALLDVLFSDTWANMSVEVMLDMLETPTDMDGCFSPFVAEGTLAKLRSFAESMEPDPGHDAEYGARVPLHATMEKVWRCVFLMCVRAGESLSSESARTALGTFSVLESKFPETEVFRGFGADKFAYPGNAAAAAGELASSVRFSSVVESLFLSKVVERGEARLVERVFRSLSPESESRRRLFEIVASGEGREWAEMRAGLFRDFVLFSLPLSGAEVRRLRPKNASEAAEVLSFSLQTIVNEEKANRDEIRRMLRLMAGASPGKASGAESGGVDSWSAFWRFCRFAEEEDMREFFFSGLSSFADSDKASRAASALSFASRRLDGKWVDRLVASRVLPARVFEECVCLCVLEGGPKAEYLLRNAESIWENEKEGLPVPPEAALEIAKSMTEGGLNGTFRRAKTEDSSYAAEYSFPYLARVFGLLSDDARTFVLKRMTERVRDDFSAWPEAEFLENVLRRNYADIGNGESLYAVNDAVVALVLRKDVRISYNAEFVSTVLERYAHFFTTEEQQKFVSVVENACVESVASRAGLEPSPEGSSESAFLAVKLLMRRPEIVSELGVRDELLSMLRPQAKKILTEYARRVTESNVEAYVDICAETVRGKTPLLFKGDSVVYILNALVRFLSEHPSRATAEKFTAFLANEGAVATECAIAAERLVDSFDKLDGKRMFELANEGVVATECVVTSERLVDSFDKSDGRRMLENAVLSAFTAASKRTHSEDAGGWRRRGIDSTVAGEKALADMFQTWGPWFGEKLSALGAAKKMFDSGRGYLALAVVSSLPDAEESVVAAAAKAPSSAVASACRDALLSGRSSAARCAGLVRALNKRYSDDPSKKEADEAFAADALRVFAAAAEFMSEHYGMRCEVETAALGWAGESASRLGGELEEEFASLAARLFASGRMGTGEFGAFDEPYL